VDRGIEGLTLRNMFQKHPARSVMIVSRALLLGDAHEDEHDEDPPSARTEIPRLHAADPIVLGVQGPDSRQHDSQASVSYRRARFGLGLRHERSGRQGDREVLEDAGDSSHYRNEERSPARDDGQQLAVRPAVSGGSVRTVAPYAQAFIEYSRPFSAFGRLTASMKKVPFRTKVPRGTAGAATGWVAEAGVIPVTSEQFDSIDTANEKMASIIVITNDLIRFGDPDVDALLREDLAKSSAQALDTSFLDPTSPAIAGVRPASITYGLTPIASSGNIATDVKALLNQVTTELVSPFLVMRPRLAANIAGLNTQLTRDLTVDGGVLAGIPVVVTGSMPRTANSPADDQIVLLDADSIQYADGGIDISASNEATIMMDTAPDSPPIPSSVATSFFQQGLTGLRLIRYLTWKTRRPGAVAILTGANY
jgi:HK97 family phage major capsid protein